MKADEILESLGPFGKYQLRQMVWIGMSTIAGSFPLMVIVFHTIIPDHRCRIPDLSVNDAYAITSAEQNTSVYENVPLDNDGSLDSCKLYDGNKTTSCDVHLFNRESYPADTVITKFNLVCDRTVLNTTSKVIYTAGLMVGAAAAGMIADRFGRKKTLVLALIIASLLGIITIFSVNIYMYSALRFGIAFCVIGLFVTDHAMGVEITGPSKRTKMQSLKQLAWPTGVMLISPMAYLVRDWSYLQLAVTVPGFIAALLIAIFMRPSPQWLISKGRHQQAVAVFTEIAAINGSTISEKLLEQIKEQEKEAQEERLLSIFKAHTLLMRTLIMCYLWLVCGMGYWGLSLGVGNLVGDIYVNNFISGAVELPVALVVLFSGYTGRKKPFIILMFVGATALIGSAFMTAFLNMEVYGIAVTAVAMVGKLSVTAVLAFCYFWGSEMFPTTLRTSLTGVCSFCARIGFLLAPVVGDLPLYVNTVLGKGIPFLVFGLPMLIGGILAFFLPETNQRPVPQTIEQANQFQTNMIKQLEKTRGRATSNLSCEENSVDTKL